MVRLIRNTFLRALLLLIICLLLEGCAIVVFPGLYPRKTKLREVKVQEAEGWFVTKKILLIDVSGILVSTEHTSIFGSSKNAPDGLKEILKKAEEDPHIKAVLLRIDSPGGDVTTCDVLYRELKDFKEKTGKVIVAEMMNLAASGGYYVAMAADKVYAHPTTLTGSIGVIAIFPKLEGLASKIGIDIRTIKSGDKKDIGSMWRDFKPEERKILQSLIDQYYEHFLDVIAENRPNLSRQKLRHLADGRVFTAQQALDAGLIDGIAYLSEAIKLAQKEAGISDSKVVMYRRAHQFKNNIYSLAPGLLPKTSINAQIGLVNLDAEGFSLNPVPRFLYLWQP